jgi:muramoyltetrapeptide carboxypeptidase
MIIPRRLEHGATIGVFSPSEPITPSRADRLESSLALLRGHGYKAYLAPNALATYYYMAGTAKERADDIHHLIRHSEVDALISSWGGKSANQLVHRLDYTAIARAKKPIMGFSDAGVLLNAITARTGLITYYGPNVAGKLKETKHSSLSMLHSSVAQDHNLLGFVDEVPHVALRDGKAAGRLFGGNLSTFVLGCLGSGSVPKYDEGGIFFWESASEPIQIIDQHLTCLRNAGVFESVTAMIVGDFIHGDKPGDYKRRDPLETILGAVGKSAFPIVYCPTFGHPEQLENPILPIGALCELSSESMSLRAVHPIVK